MQNDVMFGRIVAIELLFMHESSAGIYRSYYGLPISFLKFNQLLTIALQTPLAFLYLRLIFRNFINNN
jgi:hypothetical protein